MVHHLNNFQEKALSVFMDKYGTDAGVEVVAIFEKTGSLGRAMIAHVLYLQELEGKENVIGQPVRHKQ